MMLVEFDHVLERKIASDIRIEDEKWLRIFSKNISSQCQRSSRSQGLSLMREEQLDPNLIKHSYMCKLSAPAVSYKVHHLPSQHKS
jgi:hypothetical protein